MPGSVENRTLPQVVQNVTVTDNQVRPPAPARRPTKPKLTFTKLEEADRFKNFLYYGEGGTGKTTALAHMAHAGPVLVVNAEGGMKARALRILNVPLENIAVFPDASQALTFESLQDLYWQIKGDLQDDPNAWAGIGWDSISEIHKVLLGDVREAEFKKAVAKGNPNQRTEFFTDRSDYGEMAEQVRRLLRRFRDLPCHFVVTALERRDQDNDGKVVYQPAVTPALQGDLFGFMDCVIHTSMDVIGDNEVFFGLTKPAGKYRGKDRYGALPLRMVSPTFDRCVAYIDDNLTLDTDEVYAAAKALREKAPQERRDGD